MKRHYITVHTPEDVPRVTDLSRGFPFTGMRLAFSPEGPVAGSPKSMKMCVDWETGYRPYLGEDTIIDGSVYATSAGCMKVYKAEVLRKTKEIPVYMRWPPFPYTPEVEMIMASCSDSSATEHMRVMFELALVPAGKTVKEALWSDSFAVETPVSAAKGDGTVHVRIVPPYKRLAGGDGLLAQLWTLYRVALKEDADRGQLLDPASTALATCLETRGLAGLREHARLVRQAWSDGGAPPAMKRPPHEGKLQRCVYAFAEYVGRAHLEKLVLSQSGWAAPILEAATLAQRQAHRQIKLVNEECEQLTLKKRTAAPCVLADMKMVIETPALPLGPLVRAAATDGVASIVLALVPNLRHTAGAELCAILQRGTFIPAADELAQVARHLTAEWDTRRLAKLAVDGIVHNVCHELLWVSGLLTSAATVASCIPRCLATRAATLASRLPMESLPAVELAVPSFSAWWALTEEQACAAGRIHTTLGRAFTHPAEPDICLDDLKAAADAVAAELLLDEEREKAAKAREKEKKSRRRMARRAHRMQQDAVASEEVLAPPPVAEPVEAEDTDEAPECVVCMSAFPTYMVEPCRHVCLCKRCSAAAPTSECPICRRSATGVVRVFFC